MSTNVDGSVVVLSTAVRLIAETLNEILVSNDDSVKMPLPVGTKPTERTKVIASIITSEIRSIKGTGV